MNQFAVQFGRLVVSYSFISIATLLIERLPKGKERKGKERKGKDRKIRARYSNNCHISAEKRNIETFKERERERAIKIL